MNNYTPYSLLTALAKIQTLILETENPRLTPSSKAGNLTLAAALCLDLSSDIVTTRIQNHDH